MNITEQELASSTLTQEHLDAAVTELKILGYTVLEKVIGQQSIGAIRTTFLNLLEQFVAKTDPNRGANRYGMPLPFAEPFATEQLVANPFVTAILTRLLGPDFVCSFFASDTPLPGSDYQHAHSDSSPLFPEQDTTVPPFAYVVNVPLVDVGPDNGPLEIWPYGTHLIADSTLVPVAEFTDIAGSRGSAVGRLSERMGPQAVLVPAGSFVIRDIRMWHRGTPNRSDEARPQLAMVFNRPWYRHGVVEIDKQTFYLLPETAKHLFRLAIVR